jgi:hypothetical protein
MTIAASDAATLSPLVWRGLAVVVALAAPAALAQTTPLNRCVAADGTAVFTDRPCDALDARPALPAPASPDALPDRVATVRECARNPVTLVEAIEKAFAAGDGNRLAEHYDWRGRGSASAHAVMPRLEALATSRVVEVRTAHSAEGSGDTELAAESSAVPPDRLRIVHAPMAGGTSATTEFRLVRASGCWLIAD